MDHREIEEENVAARYLRRELAPSARVQFEQHFVDCPECMDRLALAEMFGEPEPPRWARMGKPERWRRNVLLVLVLAAVLGGPVAFWAGERLGAVRPSIVRLPSANKNAIKVSNERALVLLFDGKKAEVDIVTADGRTAWRQADVEAGIVLPRRALAKGRYEVLLKEGRIVRDRYPLEVDE